MALLSIPKIKMFLNKETIALRTFKNKHEERRFSDKEIESPIF